MIIITGGAGFIGSNLVAGLASRHERIVVCDWLGRDDKWRNISKHELDHIIAPENLEAFLNEFQAEVKAIFHMGAISTTTETDADLIIDTNFRLSRHLWNWCALYNKPFIYASSAATYGDGSAGFNDDESLEALDKLHQLNTYAWSKHLFDRWVARQKQNNNKKPPQSVGLKFFNVYGPNEYHKGNQRSVAEQIFASTVRKEAFPLFKSYNADCPDGGQLRDFVWVGDLVKVMLWFLDHPHINGLFNVGTGKARSFIDLANAVYAAVGQKPNITYREMPPELKLKYQYFTEARMHKLVKSGYTSPFIGLEEGVNLYVKHYLSKEDKYA